MCAHGCRGDGAQMLRHIRGPGSVSLARLVPSTRDSTSGIWCLLTVTLSSVTEGVNCASVFHPHFFTYFSPHWDTQCLHDFSVPPGMVVA